MSTKAKGLNKEKIFKELSKCDFDERLSFYNELKEELTKEALERSEKAQEESERYLSIKDKINK